MDLRCLQCANRCSSCWCCTAINRRWRPSFQNAYNLHHSGPSLHTPNMRDNCCSHARIHTTYLCHDSVLLCVSACLLAPHRLSLNFRLAWCHLTFTACTSYSVLSVGVHNPALMNTPQDAIELARSLMCSATEALHTCAMTIKPH